MTSFGPASAKFGGRLGTIWCIGGAPRCFGPIDVLGSRLVNMDTLDARTAVLLHLPALLAILGAIWVVFKRLTPHYRLCFPLAVLLWCLHLATNVVFWQHDTFSQTWVTACGLWVGLLVWEGVERAWAGKPIGRQAVALPLLCVLGVLAKEVFYGWLAAVGALLLIAGTVALRRRQGQVVAALGILFLAVTLIPVCFLALRWFAGGMSRWAGRQQVQVRASGPGMDLSRFDSTGTGRYKARLGVNVLRNAALATMGYFALAPIHVLPDPDAPLALRIVPLLAIGLNILLCVGPWLIVWGSHRDWPARPCGKTVAAIVFVTFFSISATLPMGQISEQYLWDQTWDRPFC